MLVVGTPRPSSSILGEVADNGFFESTDFSQAANTASFNSEYDEDDDWNAAAFEDRRDSRTRSESFHEQYDEKAKEPPIVLAGDQPLLTRQLNIVTNLANLNPEGLSSTTIATVGGFWGAIAREELAEEEALAKEEANVLEKWRAVGGRGKPDLPTTDKKGAGVRKRSNANPSSALVPSLHSGEANEKLLPRFEDKVQVFVLCDPVANAQEAKLEWRTVDFNDATGRRVHCLLWELHPKLETFEDAVVDAFINGSDAIVVLGGFHERINKLLSRAMHSGKVVVVTHAFGTNPAAAKKNAAHLGAHFDAKGCNGVEIAARDVVLKTARLRGERNSVLSIMEKQLKRTEKGKGTCAIM